jgi:hypothetical protein
MQIPSVWRLYARLVSFQRAARNRRSAHGDVTGTPVSPILIFTAVALLLILAILEIDLHREELRALGLVFRDEGLDYAGAFAL